MEQSVADRDKQLDDLKKSSVDTSKMTYSEPAAYMAANPDAKI